MLDSRSRSSVALNSFRGCSGFGLICASGIERSALRGSSLWTVREEPADGRPASSASSPRPRRRGFSVDIIPRENYHTTRCDIISYAILCLLPHADATVLDQFFRNSHICLRTNRG